MFLDRREQSTKVRGGFSLHLHSSLDFVGLGGLQTMHTLLSEEHTEKKFFSCDSFLQIYVFENLGMFLGNLHTAFM